MAEHLTEYDGFYKPPDNYSEFEPDRDDMTESMEDFSRDFDSGSLYDDSNFKITMQSFKDVSVYGDIFKQMNPSQQIEESKFKLDTVSDAATW